MGAYFGKEVPPLVGLCLCLFQALGVALSWLRLFWSHESLPALTLSPFSLH